MTKKKSGKGDDTPQNRRRITLRDIARETGFSHATVSRALRNDQKISEPTKRLIKEKAEEMGYSPDPMLYALSNYRLAKQDKMVQASLAWINLFEHPEELREYHVFDLYWKGAADAARNFGFHLEEFRLVDYPIHRLDSILKARGIRGIVMSPSTFTDAHLLTLLDGFPWQDYATVRFGQSAHFLGVNFISSSQVNNTILAFGKIREKGYKRIGFVGQYFLKFLFGAGYLWAQQAIPQGQQLPPLFYNNDDALIELQERLAVWIEETKPDAILSDKPEMLNMLKNLDYSIPDDIGLCALSVNDTQINVGIDQNPGEIGRAAIRSLVAQLHENNFGIPQIQTEILVEGHWVDGSMLPYRL